MITYYNRTRMTAVPTGLLQDTHLSVEAKGFAAIFYACLLYTSDAADE